MARYITTAETRSETKVYRFIYLKDFFFLLVALVITIILAPMVHSIFVVPFYIFSAIVGVFFVLPSKSNPTRRNYMSICIMLSAKKIVYCPLPYQQQYLSDYKKPKKMEDM